MPLRRALVIVVLALGLAVVAAACGGDEEEATPPAADTGVADTGAAPAEPTPPAEGGTGGIYRVSATEFAWTNAFDPTGEYLGDAWGIYTNLLLRTLVSTNHIAGGEGNVLYPDLATDLPEISEDGLTYTFTLKDGIKFGPPVSREITSKDILYAFQRIQSEELVAQYAGYFNVIDGFKVQPGGLEKPIAGIETPDDKTIVFHLTTPTGDFINRISMPATAPIPEEVAKCFTKPGEYGRFLIASGPYMIEGSDALDITSCDTMKPISGLDPNSRLSMVRNPEYDPATDTTEMRENLPDGFEYTLNTNQKDIFNKIEAGELEGEVGSGSLPDVLRKYVTQEELKDRLQVNSADRTWYIFLNLTVPPFDDLHVRKAASLVMDKTGLQRAWGGETSGAVATHIVPDAMFGGNLDDFDPYPSADHAGDVEAAKAEMKQSKYDTDQDGLCDAEVCKGALHVTRNLSPWTEMVPVIEDSLQKIGITLTSRELKDQYPVVQTVSKSVALGSGVGWGKDYADASTYMGQLLDGRLILATGNTNYALIGLTPEQATKVNAKGNIESVPSIDADIDKCQALIGDARQTCWEELDKSTMEDIVPWIPYLDANAVDFTGPAVTQYVFDQFAGTMGWAHLAVDPSLQK